MQTEELVVVAEYNNTVEAEMAKSILSCAGIHADIRNALMSNIYPGVIPSQLVVAAEDAEQAKTLLEIR